MNLQKSIVLAVGTFDGVHRGHQMLIQEMKRLGKVVIYTFPNHPREFLEPPKPVQLIITPEEKRKLLEHYGADLVIMKPFTKALSELSYDTFLTNLHEDIPFDHLFFGEYDTIGKNREGTPDKIRALGLNLHFTTHYIPKLQIDGIPCSSSAIRKALANGDISTVEKLLGRHLHT